MIIRDSYGIIVQRAWHTTPDQVPDDGGDSVSRTGLMASCGSNFDKSLLTYFVTFNGDVVRHPFQEIWNKPELMSRDQLVPFIAGLNEAKLYGTAKRIFYRRQ